MFDKMLNFTKTVSCSVIGTAQQIDTKLMHPFEKFCQNLLVKFYSVKDFSFLTHELKQRKTLAQGLLLCKHWKSQALPCALEAIIIRCLCFQIKRFDGLRHDMLINEEPFLGQVNLCVCSKLLC